MVDCSEKRPFICERSSTRFQARNLQEKLPAELPNDLSQSLPIFLNDLKLELEDTVPALQTQSQDLITIIQANPTVNGLLGAVIGAINALKGVIGTLKINLVGIQCSTTAYSLLMSLHDNVLVKIDFLLQRESSLPAFLSEMDKVAVVQYFANKLKKRHLGIQSSILKVCP